MDYVKTKSGHLVNTLRASSQTPRNATIDMCPAEDLVEDPMPNLLLLHGWGGGLALWRFQIQLHLSYILCTVTKLELGLGLGLVSGLGLGSHDGQIKFNISYILFSVTFINRNNLEGLAQHFNVFAIDLVGWGLSSRDSGTYSDALMEVVAQKVNTVQCS